MVFYTVLYVKVNKKKNEFFEDLDFLTTKMKQQFD